MSAGMAAEGCAFRDLPLHADVARALAAMGFARPSPIQLRALPVALFGNDVVGQAKSGTGKTAVFGVAAVEQAIRREETQRRAGDAASMERSTPSALILAPTREIAVQIESVLRQLAQFRPDVRVCACIGGLPVAHDQRRLRDDCSIVVGTPGRVKALIELRALACHSLRLFVLDEVDKLLARDFDKEIQYIVAALPERRQTLAFSATFTADQLEAVAELMRTPQIVRVRGPDDVTVEFIASASDLSALKERERANTPELWLRRVKQFYSVVSGSEPNAALQLKAKIVKLVALLADIAFSQCMVFCNDKLAAEALATALSSQGWPAASITGAQTQEMRLQVMEDFRAYRSRVLVSTDLTARGIDVDKVNFVVNLDLPRDPATYLHRVGRTGRFGGKLGVVNEHGIAVTLLSEREVEGIKLLGRVFKMDVHELPSPVPREIFAYTAASPEDKLSGQDVRITDEKQVKTEHVDEQRMVPGKPDTSPDADIAAARETGIDISVAQVEADELENPLVGSVSSEYDREEALYSRWIENL